MTIGKFPAVKGKCPFCNYEAEMVVIVATSYDGEVTDKGIYDKLALARAKEKVRSVEHYIALPTWFSRVLLCGNCGAAHVQDDKAAAAKVRSRDVLVEK